MADEKSTKNMRWQPVSGSRFERRLSGQWSQVISIVLWQVVLCCSHSRATQLANVCTRRKPYKKTPNWLYAVSIPGHSTLYKRKPRLQPGQDSVEIYLSRHSKKSEQANTNTGTPLPAPFLENAWSKDSLCQTQNQKRCLVPTWLFSKTDVKSKAIPVNKYDAIKAHDEMEYNSTHS